MPATLRRVAQHACFGSCQLGCTPDFKPFPGMADRLPEELMGLLQENGTDMRLDKRRKDQMMTTTARKDHLWGMDKVMATTPGRTDFKWQTVGMFGVYLLLILAEPLHGEHPAPPGRANDFHVSSELVVVPTTVTDRTGHTVLGLQPEDFTLVEEGMQQRIVSFSRWDAPASVGVVFDSSGSMKPSVKVAGNAIRVLLADNGTEDEAFLVTFADAPRLEVEFTREVDRLSNNLLWREARGSTALFDAIYLGLHEMHRAANARKALIVVTDGGDNHSRYSFDELLAAARESEVQIYVVAIRRNVKDIEEQRGRLQLDCLAIETGGRLLIVEGEAQLSKAMASVNELIRNVYLLAYRPADSVRDGKWRRVRIRLEPKLAGHYRISAKGGYYAPEH